MAPKSWWSAPEPIARNAASLIRIRSRLIRIRSHELAERARELHQRSERALAQSAKLVRRARWVLRGRPLPRLIVGGKVARRLSSSA